MYFPTQTRLVGFLRIYLARHNSWSGFFKIFLFQAWAWWARPPGLFTVTVNQGGEMTPRQLSDKLKHMYHHAPEGEMTTMVHLFGIQYADEIGNCGVREEEIVSLSGIHKKPGKLGKPKSWAVEVRKGKRLAQYVTVKAL